MLKDVIDVTTILGVLWVGLKVFERMASPRVKQQAASNPNAPTLTEPDVVQYLS